MSWPSTFLLATVKMLLPCSRLLAASGGQKAPWSATGEGLGCRREAVWMGLGAQESYLR